MVKLLNKLLLFAAYLLLIPSTSMLYSWHLFIHKTQTLQKAEMELQDIGNIFGNDITVQEKTILQKTNIGYGPLETTTWDKAKIKELLKEHSIYPESLRGENIKLHVNLKEISSAEIKSKIQEKYEKFFNKEDFLIQVQDTLLIPEYLNFDIEISHSSLPGKKDATLTFPENPKLLMKNISYVFLKKHSTWIATEPLKAGQRITRENIIQKEIFSEILPEKSEEFPVGFEVLKNIQAGESLDNSNIRKKIDIMAGDRIEFYYFSGNLSIESEVKAAESGRIGQVIRFRNSKNKYFYGELISKSRAIYKTMD